MIFLGCFFFLITLRFLWADCQPNSSVSSPESYTGSVVWGEKEQMAHTLLIKIYPFTKLQGTECSRFFTDIVRFESHNRPEK